MSVRGKVELRRRKRKRREGEKKNQKKIGNVVKMLKIELTRTIAYDSWWHGEVDEPVVKNKKR